MSVCYSVSKRVIDTHKWLQPTRHTHRTLCDMCRSVTEKNFVDLGGCGAWRFLCLASLTSRVHSERERARDQEKKGGKKGRGEEREETESYVSGCRAHFAQRDCTPDPRTQSSLSPSPSIGLSAPSIMSGR